jgi:copper chaperone CopZ
MKTLHVRLLLMLVGLTLSFSAEAKPSKKTILFNVSMHCHSCEKKIEKNLSYEPGVMKLKTNLKDNTVEITYNENKTDIETLMKAFKKIGYSAFPVGESCANKKGGCLNNSPTQINTMK